MKLYELERGESFKLAGDPDSPVFILERLDGSYSRCYIKDSPRSIYHFAGYTPVLRIDNE